MDRVRRSIDGQPIVTYEPINQKALAKGTQRDDCPKQWVSKKDFARIFNGGRDDVIAKSSKLLLTSGKEEPYMEKRS